MISVPCHRILTMVDISYYQLVYCRYTSKHGFVLFSTRKNLQICEANTSFNSQKSYNKKVVNIILKGRRQVNIIFLSTRQSYNQQVNKKNNYEKIVTIKNQYIIQPYIYQRKLTTLKKGKKRTLKTQISIFINMEPTKYKSKRNKKLPVNIRLFQNPNKVHILFLSLLCIHQYNFLSLYALLNLCLLLLLLLLSQNKKDTLKNTYTISKLKLYIIQ
eukprot:TRINITY_DN1920_c1_g1_i6.p1 TRINITY_DN1920_c1_g1~~TRINITY_DN1920_c1_g1_i6.p1  ORF type:complete len:216 (-),score=-19.29 TRINITY_DN1920_c1_g1_i6:269-916(-)